MAKASRTIREEMIQKPEDFVTFIMEDFFAKNGFQKKEVKGEEVWTNGIGMLEMPKFMKYTYENGVLHLEAWVKTTWLPGVYGKEQSLDGYVGTVPKQSFKKEIDALIQILYQPVPENDYRTNSPIEVQCFDTSKKATTGLIWALVGIPFAFLGGWLALVFASFAILNGKKGMNSSKRNLATAAFIMGIIEIVVFVVVFVLSILLTFAAM